MSLCVLKIFLFKRPFCQSDVVLGCVVCSHLCVVDYTGGQDATVFVARCNCRNKAQCPLDNKLLVASSIRFTFCYKHEVVLKFNTKRRPSPLSAHGRTWSRCTFYRNIT